MDNPKNNTKKEFIEIGNISNSEINIGHNHDNYSSEDDNTNSFIEFFLDTFNFKKFLSSFLRSQNRFKITQNLINIILLFIFLLFIFWQTDTLSFQKKSTTITLALLLIAAILEFLGANTSIFKGLFDNDFKTKKFIQRIHFLRPNEIKNEAKSKVFSSKCLDYFISKLKDVNSYPPNVVYIMLNSQFLSKQNLDLLFSVDIIHNLSPKLIQRILFKNENQLTKNNISTIYDTFSYNRTVIKTLIATQEYSYFLIDSYPKDTELSGYFDKYQKNKEHLDWLLKLIPIRKLNQIQMSITLFFGVGLIILYTFGLYVEGGSKIPINFQPEDIAAMFVGTLIVVLFIKEMIIVRIFNTIHAIFYNRFIANLI